MRAILDTMDSDNPLGWVPLDPPVHDTYAPQRARLGRHPRLHRPRRAAHHRSERLSAGQVDTNLPSELDRQVRE
jgi:hypothetical protein